MFRDPVEVRYFHEAETQERSICSCAPIRMVKNQYQCAAQWNVLIADQEILKNSH